MSEPQPIQLRDLPDVGAVGQRFQSYNVEMVEVIGGRFWKPYVDRPSGDDHGSAAASDPGTPVDLALSEPVATYTLSADALSERTAQLNGRDLILGDDDAPPDLIGSAHSDIVRLEPQTVTYLVTIRSPGGQR